MHWYYANGQPCYELPNASKPGVMRGVNIKDARKLTLVPSVTTIQRAISKPELDTWKLRNVAVAALANPKGVEEAVDGWTARVLEAAEAESQKARGLGGNIHDYLETVLTGGTTVADYSKYTENAIDWLQHEFANMKLEFEKHIPVTYYGGRCDVCGDNVIIDWKTQSTKGGKFKFYTEWPEQLAAYAKALNQQNPRMISACISSTEQGVFEVKEWDNYPYWYASFEACYKVWSVRNNYGLFTRKD